MVHHSWVDGVKTDRLLVSDRGLAYGDGVFETVRVASGKLVLPDFHWDRLKKGCKRLNIKLEWIRLLTYINDVLNEKKKDTGILKIIITRGSGGRGYSSFGTSWRSIIQWFSLPAYPLANKTVGVQLYPCKTMLASQPLLAEIKHLNRLENVLARSEWQSSEYAEGLMCSTDGQVVEGTMSNIFIVHHGVLITPDLSQYGVEGVMRRWILANKCFSFPIEVCSVTLSMFNDATEVFVCNSVFGVWPVIGYKEHAWQLGSITRLIQKQVELLFNG